MRTTGSELRSEATIYAEGTDYNPSTLVREYNVYADRFEEVNGTPPDDFLRWIQREHPECCQ